MPDWFLIACLLAATVGVLTFLRIVCNEIDAAGREVESFRKRELAKQRPNPDEVVTASRAA